MNHLREGNVPQFERKKKGWKEKETKKREKLERYKHRKEIENS